MASEESFGKDFHERFLGANANLDFIAAQFADVIRDLMRAVSSNDPSTSAFQAAKKMDFVVELLSRTEDKFGFYQLFLKALSEFKDEDSDQLTVEGAIVTAAQRGVKFLVERSCRDGAARGRSSRRENEFLTAIKFIDEARGYRRERGPRL